MSEKNPCASRAIPSSLSRIAFLLLAALLVGPDISAADKPATSAFQSLDRALRVGVRVSVKGRLLPHGVLEADEVELAQSNDPDEELQGQISAVDVDDRTFSLLGRTVRLRSRTRYTREPDSPASIDDLREGLRVKVDGETEPDGRLKADKVRIYRDQTPRSRVKIEGLITTIEPSDAGLARLGVAGLHVLLTPATELIDARGGSRPIVRRLGIADEDDLQFTRNTRLGRHVIMAGEVRLRAEYLSNLDLEQPDDDQPEDDVELVSETSAQLGFAARLGQAYAYASVAGAREFVIRSEDPFEDGTSSVRIREAYVQWPLTPGVSVAIGRQRFIDERDWYYATSNLDAVRLFAAFHPLTVEASYSRDLFDNSRNLRDQDLTNLIVRTSYRVARDVDLEAYFVDRDDRTELNDSPRTVGLRLLGDPGRRVEFWLDAAHQSGTFCSRESGRPCSRSVVPDEFTVRDIRAHAFDMGLTYRPRIRLDPTFSVSYALGSGEDDGRGLETTATSFHQTGLHRNRWRFNGVVSFRYYGEVIDPDLTNLGILTLGVGLRPKRSCSLDLIYHEYRQDEPSRIFHEFEIDESPSGMDSSIGSEWNLMLGYEPSRRFELRLTAGVFEPGAAFDSDATSATAVRFQSKFRF